MMLTRPPTRKEVAFGYLRAVLEMMDAEYEDDSDGDYTFRQGVLWWLERYEAGELDGSIFQIMGSVDRDMARGVA